MRKRSRGHHVIRAAVAEVGSFPFAENLPSSL